MNNVPFNSNSSVLSAIKEEKTGDVPITGKALVLQPNSIDSFGNSIETAARNPISTSRDAKKGAIINLSSSVEAPQDLTISAYRFFSEGAMCSTYEGLATHIMENSQILDNQIVDFVIPNTNTVPGTIVIATGFKNDANNGEKQFTAISQGLASVDGVVAESTKGKLTYEYPEIAAVTIDIDGKINCSGSTNYPLGSIVELSDFTTPTNNGMFTVVDNTGDKLTVTGDNTLTEELAPTGTEKMNISYTVNNIVAEKGGYRYGSPFMIPNAIIFNTGYANNANNGIKIIGVGDGTGKFGLTSDTTLVNEIPTKSATYFVGYKFEANQVTIDTTGALLFTNGGETALPTLKLSVGSAIWIGGLTEESKFDDVNANGLARIANIDLTSNKITLDKRMSATKVFTSDLTPDQKKIEIYIGEFIKTRPIGSDGYQEPSYTFELKTVNEENKSYYEYSRGNQINTLELGLSTNAIASMSLSTVGTKTDEALTTPMEWQREEPRFQEAFSTPSDVFRLRVTKSDEAGLMSVFTNATFAINNNIGTENVIGELGAYRTSLGAFAVTLTGTAVFMSQEVASAITNNCTISADFLLENLDGGIYVDIPNATISDGSRDFTANEKIKQNVTVTAFGNEKSIFDYSVSSTIFYWLPTNKAELC